MLKQFLLFCTVMTLLTSALFKGSVMYVNNVKHKSNVTHCNLKRDIKNNIINYITKNNRNLTMSEIEDIADIIMNESDTIITPTFILAVIQTESRFDKKALSHVGAMGLMQLMPETGKAMAREMGIYITDINKLYNPQLNVTLGIAYLKKLNKRFGNDVNYILAAYNMGPTLLNRLKRKNPHKIYKYTKIVIENTKNVKLL